jgi:CheY-like chemotaxis protein
MSRILVAEDDPHILRLISMWLQRQGHTVVEARNGLMARDLLQAEPVDVLVTDINMPGLDGVTLVESALQTSRVRQGIVVLTNRWDHGEIRDRLAVSGVHVIPKPFSPSRLSELVESLTGGTAAEPEVAHPRAGDEGRT